MRRLKQVNFQAGSVILLYSILVTAVFLVGFTQFQRNTQTAQDTGATIYSSMYVLDQNDLNVEPMSGKLSFSPNRLISTDTIGQAYQTQLLQQLLPMTVFFCVFLIGSSLVLWMVLKSIQEKDRRKISARLQAIAQTNGASVGNAQLENAYQEISKKFEENLNDYKRLNSYLSHEQKNALAILRTNLELNENTEYLRSLDLISDSIDDILTLSENTESALLSEVDVALVCAQVCDTYSKLSDSISFKFDEEANTTIAAKERWIVRAVSNLLDNAVKYGEGRPIEVAVSNRHHCVLFTVRDHGIGISEENQSRVFDHRYRINELKKDGYGIGLSLVSHVCDQCGGFVTLDSCPGKGSVFYLSFPCLETESAASACC